MNEKSTIPIDEHAPARARLTFDGVPMIRSYGIFADFSMKAVNSFIEAVVSVAASLSAPLATMGPIPNCDQNQLLITNTAVGWFSFELEEYRAEQLALDEVSPIAIALERTQALLQSTLDNDDDLADIASETDSRALDKVRTFLKMLADNSAVCALQYGGSSVRFIDVGQVNRSLARLAAYNLHKSEEQLRGEFVGVLPNSRNFEFKFVGNQQIIRGKIPSWLQNVNDINDHLYQIVQINVIRTQVGNGRPRYLLTQMPQWAQS